MRRLACAWVVGLLLASTAAHAETITKSLSRALANALYCQLAGCTMTGTILAPNGTSAAPSYSFTNFPTRGMYANTNLGLAQGTGSLLVTGTTAAPTALTAALVLIAGNVDVGSHSYQVTYVTAGGETTAGTTSNAVVSDGTHGQNSLSAVPLGGAYVTQRKIYRNKVADQTHWFLQQTIANNTATTGVQDNTADSGLGAAMPTTNTAIDDRFVVDSAGAVNAYGIGLQIHASKTEVDSGGYWGSTGTSNALMLSGASNDGVNYVAKDATPASVVLAAGSFYVQGDTGKVAGNTFTPTILFKTDVGGISLPIGSIYRVTGTDFTSSSSTALQTITGLSFILPANTAANYPFRCEILYNQTIAAVSDSFGIQAASLSPTNIMAKGDVATSASVTAYGNLPTLSSTTATAIVTFTPSAITTIWNARLTGMIENPSGAANTINIMVSQSTAGDLIVVKRGSYCVVGF